MAQAMILPKRYFWDKNGLPLAFGKIYAYQAGTVIPKDTFTTEAGDVANPNPVILNGEGYASIYLDGSYAIVVDDADDANIWTEDPVSSNVNEEWVNCSAATYLSTTSFKIPGDLTTLFDVGRSVRIYSGVPTFDYAAIKSSSFAAGETTVVVSSAVVTVNIETACTSIVGVDSLPLSIKVFGLIDLIGLAGKADGDTVEMLGFFVTFPSSRFFGGGKVVYQADLDKVNANGVNVFDTDNVGGFDGTTSTLDSFSLTQGTGIGTGCWVRLDIDHINPVMAGALGDSTQVATIPIQASADAAIAAAFALRFTNTNNTASNEYLITSKLSLSAALSIYGDGATKPRILCVDCSFLDYDVGATGVEIKGILAATSTRHTTLANTYFAVKFQGDTNNRPFYPRIKDNFFDGFGKPLVLEWVWNARIRDNDILNCGDILTATGKTVNNHFTGNTCTGNGSALNIGDGTNTVEGWWIMENILDQFASFGTLAGASYCTIKDNIVDHISGATGLLMINGIGLPSIGHSIVSNYMAFSFAADEGIRMLNGVASSLNNGSTIEDNEIFAYSTFSVSKGILTDGTEEAHNNIINNRIVATVADFDNGAAANTRVDGNKFNGAGFLTTTLVEYGINHGPLISSEVLLKRSFGSKTVYRATAMPTTGDYVRGDEVEDINSTLDGNNMVLFGWKRLVTGNGHVLGTDWANMYISHTSPGA